MEGRQVDFVQGALRDVRHVVVAPALRGAVGHEVLGGCQHGVVRAQVAALEATHARGRQLRAQVRIFAASLHDAAPARIARNVDHGRVGPVQPVRGGLDGRQSRRALDQGCVPATGLADGHRENRAEAVNHVMRKQQRYAHA